MNEPPIDTIEYKTTSNWKDTVASIGGCLLYLVIALAGIAVLILLFRGVGWVSEKIYPWAMFFAGIALFVVTPGSLLLSIFRVSRGLGALGLLVASYVIGFSLWIWSLIVAYSLAGVFWLIIGLLFAGLGIVPVAFIAALLSREWSVAGQLLIMVVLVYAIRMFSFFLGTRAA